MDVNIKTVFTDPKKSTYNSAEEFLNDISQQRNAQQECSRCERAVLSQCSTLSNTSIRNKKHNNKKKYRIA